MLLKWFVLCLWAMPVLTGTDRKCPIECSCNVDEENRYTIVCEKGDLTAFKQLSPDVRVIIIKGSRQPLTIMPLKQWAKLEILRITDSSVPAIGTNTFWGLQYLRILDLSKNNITNITENNFRGQDNLKELDLSKNKILNMASSVFRHLRELQRLNLADNFISELIQRNFFMLNKLRYLDLSGNPLQDLQPEVFRDLPELKVFKCRNCQLKKINPQLYNLLPQLIELDFGRNEDEFHDVKRLKKIMLDGNQLSVVVNELFRMQKNLHYLDLSYNRLAKVPNDSFLHLGNLTYLDLSYNKLVLLEPQAVRRLGNLRTLNISGNTQMDLHAIRDTFELLPNLTHLAIADIGTLPIGLLVPFKQLRYLNISGNHLDNMSLQVLDSCQELEYLDISRNQLQGINENTALRIKGIRNVRLDNNPLICDECHMGKLINVVRHLQWNWETYPMCFLPKSLRGSRITELDAAGLDACLEYITDEEQNAASTSHNFLKSGDLNMLAILAGITFLLVIVIILGMFVCFSKHRARYYTREDRLNCSEVKCLEKNLEASVAIAAGGIGEDIGAGGGASDINSNGKNTNATTTPGATTATTTVTTPTNEINFKFPIDDRTCTIDEHILPTATTTSALAHKSASQQIASSSSCNSSKQHYHTTATLNGFSGNTKNVLPPGVPISASTPLLPPDAVVVVLPPPPALSSVTPTRLSRITTNANEQQLQQKQQQRQMLQLTSLEPMVSVN